jgi:hypothetical protein
MSSWGNPSPDPRADLEKLAAELDGQKFAVSLVAGRDKRPRLTITNREALQLTENIYCDGDFYWWGWAERIGPVGDMATAVAAIAQVLRAVDAAR